MSANNTTTYQCYDIRDSQLRIVLIVDATTRILQTLFCGLSILLLLIVLRKKAVNNPAKRFGLSVIFTLSLASLNRVVIELYPANTLPPWLCVLTMAVYCLGSTVILYLVALPIALLLQVSAPIFSERYRRTISPKIPLIEVAFQLMIVIVSVLINALQLIDSEQYSNFCRKCVTLFYYEAIALSGSVLTLFITFLTLALVYHRFRDAVVLTNRTRQVMLKVFILFLATDAAFIGDAIVSASIKKYTFEMKVAQSIFFTAVKLMFVPALIVVMYSPNTGLRSMCSCCSLAGSERAPLLQPHQSEKQHTNPDSVWDHANVPSYTPSYHPLEMSDCKTDSVNKHSSTLP